MQKILLATIFLGLAAGTVSAEPVRLDEARLQEVTAGLSGLDSLLGVNINIATPVNVNNLVGVDNTVDVTNQIGNAFSVGVVNAVGVFSDGVAAIGAATADLGLITGTGALVP